MHTLKKFIVALVAAWGGLALAVDAEEPIKVFILAGDVNVLEQGQTAPDTKDKRGNDVP